MKRLEVKNNENPNFIGNWDLENNELCDQIINFFENNSDLHIKGTTGGGVDESIKKSTDITIQPENLKDKKYDIFNKYFENLHQCFTDYKEQYVFLKTFVKKIHIGSFNIQKYLPGDHFARLHSERTGMSNIHRLFAWMTYLNDVDDGGSTYFSHYDLKIRPEIGKTLIWPAEWTHAHCGQVLNTGVKYIITGWMHFPVNE